MKVNMIDHISTDKAPKAVGPYSQAVVADNSNNLIFTSGQIPVNPQTDKIPRTIEEQASQAMENLKNLLNASESSMDKIIKTTIFIKNMDDFSKVNDVYATFFKEPYPARSCVEVSRLPKDVLIEIEAIAEKY